MSIPSAEDRAISVLKQNKYMVLSTVDDAGPWSAAVGYTAAPPNQLFFVSLMRSRHARAIVVDSRVSGVIFDSTVLPADAESIQFSGRCQTVEDGSKIMEFLTLSAKKHNSESPTQQQVEELIGESSKRLFRIEVQEMFVLDQEAWHNRQEDLRQPIEVESVFASIR